MANKRKRAAQAADDLRDSMREILATPGEDDDDISAKRHAAAALGGIEDAEEALRLCRDREEEPIELLNEEPRDQRSDIDDALAELRAAASEELREAPLEDVLEAVVPEIDSEE